MTAQTLKEQTSPEAALTAFYAQHETPDLIWSPSTRARLSAAVLEEWNAWTTANRDAGAMTPWTPRSVDPATGVRYAPAELRVAGLYVRLFNAQPGYAARMQQQHRVRFIHGLLSELAGACACVCVGNAGQSTREVWVSHTRCMSRCHKRRHTPRAGGGTASNSCSSHSHRTSR